MLLLETDAPASSGLSSRALDGVPAESVWIVIPAYNEADVIGEVLASLRPLGYQVVVIDDCSTDGTYDVARRQPWVHLLRHAFNLGQGAALQTGLCYALSKGAEYLVTFDADGQHPAERVAALLAVLVTNRVDVVLGSRFARRETPATVPLGRRLLLKLATRYTVWTTGLPVTDAHNGFRAMTRHAAMSLRIAQNRMAHATEILTMIGARRLRWIEFPVQVSYTPRSLAKGQKAWNAFNILWELAEGWVRR